MKIAVMAPGLSLSSNPSLNDSIKSIEVSDSIFDRPYNEALIHQVVTSYASNARSGNRAQKDRSDVKHSTRKPWRQKGTGNARAGMRSSPLWRGGGRIFPSSPEENFSKKVNRKMYRASICSMLSQLLREGRIAVVEDLNVSQPKTSKFVSLITDLGLSSKQFLLFVVDSVDDNLYFSSRNLPNVAVVEVKYITPLALVHCKKLVMTRKAIENLNSQLIAADQCSST